MLMIWSSLSSLSWSSPSWSLYNSTINDVGNKYGEPVVSGFTRSFGQKLPNGERVEWLKPIMFTAGKVYRDADDNDDDDDDDGRFCC